MLLSRYVRFWSKPVDNSPLVIFRIVFGLLICAEAWGAIITGWVKKAYVIPDYRFPFIAFNWLPDLPGNGIYFYFAVMGLAGFFVMMGLYYRASISVYAIMWSGVYLGQKTNYNNHYYLLMLLLFLMVLLPAHRYASFDVRRNPALKKISCPRWCLWVFVVHIAIVYFYAATAKIYPDWLEAKPIAIWFAGKKDYWLIGPILQEPWLQTIIAYGGIAFDLFIIPLMLWKPTRKVAFGITVFFHLFNSFVFHIGIFPFLGISFALFFFPPDTIRKLFLKTKPPLPQDTSAEAEAVPFNNKLIIYGLSVYMLVQLLLPLRHHLFTGSVFWTEEGHRLSWRMMLRSKSGYVHFTIKDSASGKTWNVSPEEYLTNKQSRVIATRPDMCWQFVQILKKDFAKKGYSDIEVYAIGKAAVNGRPYKALYNPEIDLAKVDWQHFAHQNWLLVYDQDRYEF